mmetsp:Transcript_99899/g.287058  ORF Transcript_99899/g.287058 Transcript_99899/m.287058 type:complete len:515 (-) Transcript_99899:191-1735(-)
MRSNPAALKTGLSTDSPTRLSSSREHPSNAHSTRRTERFFTATSSLLSRSWTSSWAVKARESSMMSSGPRRVLLRALLWALPLPVPTSWSRASASAFAVSHSSRGVAAGDCGVAGQAAAAAAGSVGGPCSSNNSKDTRTQSWCLTQTLFNLQKFCATKSTREASSVTPPGWKWCSKRRLTAPAPSPTVNWKTIRYPGKPQTPIEQEPGSGREGAIAWALSAQAIWTSSLISGKPQTEKSGDRMIWSSTSSIDARRFLKPLACHTKLRVKMFSARRAALLKEPRWLPSSRSSAASCAAWASPTNWISPICFSKSSFKPCICVTTELACSSCACALETVVSSIRADRPSKSARNPSQRSDSLCKTLSMAACVLESCSARARWQLASTSTTFSTIISEIRCMPTRHSSKSVWSSLATPASSDSMGRNAWDSLSRASQRAASSIEVASCEVPNSLRNASTKPRCCEADATVMSSMFLQRCVSFSSRRRISAWSASSAAPLAVWSSATCLARSSWSAFT